MKILLNIMLDKCFCEKCDTQVNFNDNYCKQCGNDLKVNKIIKKDLLKTRDKVFSQDEVDGLLSAISNSDLDW